MFKQVNIKSNIADDLMDAALSCNNWTKYYSFSAMEVPEELIDSDEFLSELRTIRNFRGGILRMEPNTCYNWHVDTDRRVAINMLLCDDGNSKCVFAPNGFEIVNPIVELKYKPSTYFAFDTKSYHTVLNFSEPRYLFGLEFIGDDKNLTYSELCEDLKGLNYVD